MKNFNLVLLFTAVTLFFHSFIYAQTPTGGTIGPGNPPPGTPLIIVEKIIAKIDKPCTPKAVFPVQVPSSNDFCVNRSTTNEEPYNNSCNIRVVKSGSILSFAMIYSIVEPFSSFPDLVICNQNKEGEMKLYLKTVSPTQVDCKYNDGSPSGLTIFSLTGVVSSPYQAKVEIDFVNSCDFGVCGNVACKKYVPGEPGEPGGPASSDGERGLDSSENIPNSYISPNPFSQETRINYTLETPQPVSIQVFNAQGTLVQSLVQEQQEAGDYTAILDGTQLPNGVYFAVVQVGSTRKIHSLVKSN
jgi:hypothetical protein